MVDVNLNINHSEEFLF